MKRILIAAAATAIAAEALAGIRINEIMQSNIDCLYAENEYPDSWVEFYNDSDKGMRAVGLRLGLTADFDAAYPLPGAVIFPAHGFTLVYCDKVGAQSHTDFRLDSGKGELYLFDADGTVVDHIAYKKQPAPNIAYGRESESSEKWGYQLVPSPGQPNTSGITSTVLPDPVFSLAGRTSVGVNRSNSLTISIPEGAALPADTRLYYTLDGSEPTADSESTDTSVSFNFSGIRTFRAKLISAQAVSPRSVTHSFIRHARPTDLPILSIVADERDLYDGSVGIFNNYSEDWRRPANFEYFPAGSSEALFNQLGELRIHGGWTRVNTQKSLALYSNKRFGTKNFAFNPWPDKQDAFSKVKSFVLRNGGNDFNGSRIKDSFVQTLFGRRCPSLDWQAYAPAIVYINGQYRGIYDMRERSNEDYVEINYNGLEDIDMIENWEEVKAGTIDSFLALQDLYNSSPTFEQMADAIDIENFADIYIANTWATNTDFPGNNMVMWRPTAPGGKWRWIMKDLDFLAANATWFRYFSYILRTGSHTADTGEGNRPHTVKLFQVMTAMPEFRDILIDRFMVYLGDFLRESVVSDLLDEQRDAILSEYEDHLAAYGYPNSFNGWLGAIEGLRGWCTERTKTMPGIIRDYFELGALVPFTVIRNGAAATINGVPVTCEDFVGYWNVGRPITLHTTDDAVAWRVTTETASGGVQTNVYDSPTFNYTPNGRIKSLKIEAVEGSGAATVDAPAVRIFAAGGAIHIESPDGIATATVHDLSGRPLATLTPGTSPADCSAYTAAIPVASGLYLVTVTTPAGLTYRRLLPATR